MKTGRIGVQCEGGDRYVVGLWRTHFHLPFSAGEWVWGKGSGVELWVASLRCRSLKEYGQLKMQV